MSLLKNHYKILFKGILGFSVAFSVLWGINTYKQNKKLSESLKMAQNNIEAYLGIIDDSLAQNNVLKLDISNLSTQNDKLLHKIDSVMKVNKIKSSNVNTAATQTQTIYVTKVDKIKGDIITILKDTVYKDTVSFNNLTKLVYDITKDSTKFSLDIKNTLYLYIYKTKEYKNKKKFLKRLITLDFKKVYKYKYKIVNTNDLIKEDSVRVIESTNIK